MATQKRLAIFCGLATMMICLGSRAIPSESPQAEVPGGIFEIAGSIKVPEEASPPVVENEGKLGEAVAPTGSAKPNWKTRLRNFSSNGSRVKSYLQTMAKDWLCSEEVVYEIQSKGSYSLTTSVYNPLMASIAELRNIAVEENALGEIRKALTGQANTASAVLPVLARLLALKESIRLILPGSKSVFEQLNECERSKLKLGLLADANDRLSGRMDDLVRLLNTKDWLFSEASSEVSLATEFNMKMDHLETVVLSLELENLNDLTLLSKLFEKNTQVRQKKIAERLRELSK
jgi:hypothetical protein